MLGSCNFQALAGPLGAKPLPRHTADYLLKHLYDKEDVISFVREYTQPDSAKRFAASGAGTSMNYTIAGPLGSGRKTIVTAVANAFAEAGLVQSREVYVYTKGDLEAGYVGQTAIRTRAAINMAQGGTVVINGVSSIQRHQCRGFPVRRQSRSDHNGMTNYLDGPM